MNDPIVVASALMFPYGCTSCINPEAPFLDTQYDNPVGRVYVCSKCARDAARTFGWTSGKKLNELKNAADTIRDNEKQMEEIQAVVNDLIEATKTKDAIVKAQEITIDKLQGELKQFEHLVSGLDAKAEEMRNYAVGIRGSEA